MRGERRAENGGGGGAGSGEWRAETEEGRQERGDMRQETGGD